MGLDELSSTVGLRHLYLSNAPVRPEHLDALSAFSQLQTLDIGANPAIDDASLAHVEALADLRTLGLRSAKISDASLDRIAKLTELESLDLEGTPVTDSGVEKLVGLPRLAKLSLSRTGVSDNVTTILPRLKSLRSVALLSTPVTPASIRTLRAALPAAPKLSLPRRAIRPTLPLPARNRPRSTIPQARIHRTSFGRSVGSGLRDLTSRLAGVHDEACRQGATYFNIPCKAAGFSASHLSRCLWRP